MKHLFFTLIAVAIVGSAVAQPRMNSNQPSRPCQLQPTNQVQPGTRMSNKMSIEERAAFRAQLGAASTQEELTKIREQHRAKMMATRVKAQ